jgi:hypothetical protein
MNITRSNYINVFNSDESFIIVRPEGGLNDILCRLNYAYTYAKKFGRRLLIDTSCVGFHEPLNAYFDSRDETVSFIADDLGLFCNLPGVSFYPALPSQQTEYEATYDSSTGAFYDSLGKVCLTTNLSIPYKEKVVLYHACGGGIGSFNVFEFLSFRNDLKAEIKRCTDFLPRPYISIHLRGTDAPYQNAHNKLLTEIAAYSQMLNIYIATDSLYLLEEASSILSMHKVFNFSSQNLSDKNPIHCYNRHDPRTYDRKSINRGTLIDLGILALSDLFLFPDPNAGNNNWKSGFTCLAQFLNMNKSLLTI